MDVRDAVASRFSCRAFLPTPVPLATVREILERAARAPSGGNLQPWRVHALAGAVLEDLKARIRPHAPTNPRGEGAEYEVYPSPLKEPYNARRSRRSRLAAGPPATSMTRQPARMALDRRRSRDRAACHSFIFLEGRS